MAQNSRWHRQPAGREEAGAGNGRFPSREREFWQPRGVGSPRSAEPGGILGADHGLRAVPIPSFTGGTPKLQNPGKEAREQRTKVTLKNSQSEFQFGSPKSLSLPKNPAESRGRAPRVTATQAECPLAVTSPPPRQTAELFLPNSPRKAAQAEPCGCFYPGTRSQSRPLLLEIQ